MLPYTTIFPKPLVPIGERPILDIVLRQLAFYGFDDITMSVGHLAELIQAYIAGNPQRFADVNIRYHKEPQALGTAGALGIIPDLKETFLAINSDVLTTLDLRRLLAFHSDSEAALTIAATRKEVGISLGVIQTDESSNVIGYTEKPVLSYVVSMGVYVYEPRALTYIEPDCYLDFPDLVKRLLANGERVTAYHSEDFWLDIGRPEDYMRATDEFQKCTERFHAD